MLAQSHFLFSLLHNQSHRSLFSDQYNQGLIKHYVIIDVIHSLKISFSITVINLHKFDNTVYLPQELVLLTLFLTLREAASCATASDAEALTVLVLVALYNHTSVHPSLLLY